MLYFLDYFLTVFHVAFVLFVLFGWAYPTTRKIHVTLILLTLVAWFLVGLYKGVIGYCPLTDLHWDIKRALGEHGMPSSFIEYIIEKLTGINFPKALIDSASGAGLVFGVVMAGNTHWKERSKQKKDKKPHAI